MPLSSLATAVVLLVIPTSQMNAQAVDTKASAPVTSSSVDDYRTNPKFVEATKEAKQFERQRRVLFAQDDYKKANKIAKGQSYECVSGLYMTQMQLGDYKGSVATTTALEVLGTSPMAKSVAAYYRGLALVDRAGEKAKPAELEEAHTAFQ